MYNKYILIFTLLFLILTSFVIKNRDHGKNKESIFINDGEKIILDSVFTKFREKIKRGTRL